MSNRTPATLKAAVAIRHVGFEDLGTFEPVLVEAGYRVHYYDVGVDELWTLDPLLPSLLVVLGGPVGVYDERVYPFLSDEKDILRTRLEANLPTLGVCLGAQLIASALQAHVGPMGSKEIGFAPIVLSEDGKTGPLRHLDGVPVLHWHGDELQLPPGAINLASTQQCANQAFSLGNALGLQFHPEVDASARIERWLIGHAAELAAAGIDPGALRAEALRVGPALRVGATRLLKEWLEGLSEGRMRAGGAQALPQVAFRGSTHR